jgi:hypothetical protein
VQAIADETFAYLFKAQVSIGEANWGSAWLAILGEEMVGVTMTCEEWVSDLWVKNQALEDWDGQKTAGRGGARDTQSRA